VSDRNAGFCRLTNPSFFALPSSAGVGALDAGTCFGGPLIGAPRGPIAPGQAVFIDPPDPPPPPPPAPPPPPLVDQVMLIPDASLGSSLVWRAMAQPNGTYFAQDAVTM